MVSRDDESKQSQAASADNSEATAPLDAKQDQLSKELEMMQKYMPKIPSPKEQPAAMVKLLAELKDWQD